MYCGDKAMIELLNILCLTLAVMIAAVLIWAEI